MIDKSNKTDWADEHHKKLLVEQRKYLWTDDSIDKLAGWFGMKPGMTMADIGCGLGYLGYTFWQYLSPEAKYIGIDQSKKLLAEASDAAKSWAVDGRAEFTKGDAYNLPLADNSCDITACQTLMMHLEHPEKALKEMIRIIKPGGMIVCFEPDNVASQIYPNYWSVKDYSLDEYLLCVKVVFTCYEGAKKLGLGDRRIGVKLPRMMFQSGLVDVDVRMNEQPFWIHPPYVTDHQKHRFQQIRKNFTNEKIKEFWKEKTREEFEAGGGDPDDLEKYNDLGEIRQKEAAKHFENKEFYAFSGNMFFIIKGRKPE